VLSEIIVHGLPCMTQHPCKCSLMGYVGIVQSAHNVMLCLSKQQCGTVGLATTDSHWLCLLSYTVK